MPMKITKLMLTTIALGTVIALAIPFIAEMRRHAHAADHAEAPSVALDVGADIADVYFFLDPNETNNLIMLMTLHGFVAPQENVNLGFFDPEVRYRFELETTGDAKVDEVIDVTFAARTSTSTGQLATVTLPNRRKFTAYSTAPSLAAALPSPVLTTNEDGVVFFAGLTDDPFFFDIPAFNRFVGSVLGGSPNAAFFLRARDSFAGYNIPTIALSIPANLVPPITKGSNVNHVIGLSGRTQRRTESYKANGDVRSAGSWRNVDRMGVPAVSHSINPICKKECLQCGHGH